MGEGLKIDLIWRDIIMSIIDTFDRYGEEIIKVKNNIQEIKNFPSTVIVAFSAKFCKLL